MDSDRTLTSLTADIVAAYLAGNHVTVDDLPGLIGAVSRTVAGLGEPVEPAPEPVKGPSPSRIRNSIRPDALISFEDGKPYKQLKRHLRLLGLSPDQYRAKWGLAADYPMVASASSERRSAMAKASGLGLRTKPREASVEPVVEPAAETVAVPAKPRIKGRLGLFGKRKSAT